MKDELVPKVSDIIAYCKNEHIPIFISAYDDKKKAYWNRTVTPTELNMTISDDKYPEFIRVLTGFDFDNYKD